MTDNEQVSRVLTSNTYTLEFVAAACDKMKLQVHDREHGNEDLLAVLPRGLFLQGAASILQGFWDHNYLAARQYMYII